MDYETNYHLWLKKKKLWKRYLGRGGYDANSFWQFVSVWRDKTRWRKFLGMCCGCRDRRVEYAKTNRPGPRELVQYAWTCPPTVTPTKKEDMQRHSSSTQPPIIVPLLIAIVTHREHECISPFRRTNYMYLPLRNSSRGHSGP